MEIADFDREWKEGDREKARQMARDYVAANRERLQALERLTLPDLVERVSQCRAEGREEDRLVTDMWLLSEYQPQKIVGGINLPPEVVASAIADAMKKE